MTDVPMIGVYDDDAGGFYVLGPCVACRRLFTFNPYRVPSVAVDGVRQPICRACVDLANPRRIANGLAPIVPLDGAYDPEPEL